MSIFSGSTAMLRRVKAEIENQTSTVKEKLNQKISNLENGYDQRFSEVEGKASATETEVAKTSKKVVSIETEQTLMKQEFSTLKEQVNDLINGGSNNGKN